MNLWVVNQFIAPLSTARGTRHWSLARRIARRGHRVTLVGWDRDGSGGSDSTPPDEHEDGVRFDPVQLPTLAAGGRTWQRALDMVRYAKSLRRHLREQREPPDLIVGSTPTLFTAFIAYREARRRSVPFVLEVRDIWPQTLIDLGGYPRWHPGVLLLGILERHLYRNADHVVTLLPGAGEHIARHGGDADRVTWIPNGIDFELMGENPPPKASTAEVHSEANGPFRVVYAGAHGLANALDAVLDAALLLEERAPGSFHFDFIGKGHRKEQLAARARDEGIANVAFHPPVPKREVYAHLAGADALVVNMNEGSLYRFGISFNKLFDYLAVGRPIVFGAAAMNDPVKESGAGISVPANDAEAMARAFEELAAMPLSGREAMGQRGSAFVREHHNFDELGSRLADLLEGLVGELRQPETAGTSA